MANKIKIKRTAPFKDWLKNLKDSNSKLRITRFFERVAENGLSGDIEPVGEGVSEFRFHWGAGYRVYFLQHGDDIIVLLGGGTKRTQKQDIKDAKSLASTFTD